MSVKEKPKYNPEAYIGKQMNRLDHFSIGYSVQIFPFQKAPETVEISEIFETCQEPNPMVRLADGRIIAGATARRLKTFY